MTNCYDGMRAALRRNIEGLAHLSADQKEALLDSQMGMAISATEAGRPFVEIYGQESPKLEDHFESVEPPDFQYGERSQNRREGGLPTSLDTNR